MRRIPRPFVTVIITFAFPVLVSASWFFGYSTLGDCFTSTQIALLSVLIQKYFWTEADYHAVKHFLFGK